MPDPRKVAKRDEHEGSNPSIAGVHQHSDWAVGRIQHETPQTFDEAQLTQLTESIRSQGVLSPLLVRRVNGHFEIVFGAQRYRAAQCAGLPAVPPTVRELTDEECLEIQLIENLQRTDSHPFEEAQGFRALLDREGGKYSIETIAAKTGKPTSFIAKRLTRPDTVRRRCLCSGTNRRRTLTSNCQAHARRAGGRAPPLFRWLLRRGRQGTKPRARVPLAGMDCAQHLSESQIRADLLRLKRLFPSLRSST